MHQCRHKYAHPSTMQRPNLKRQLPVYQSPPLHHSRGVWYKGNCCFKFRQLHVHCGATPEHLAVDDEMLGTKDPRLQQGLCRKH